MASLFPPTSQLQTRISIKGLRITALTVKNSPRLHTPLSFYHSKKYLLHCAKIIHLNFYVFLSSSPVFVIFLFPASASAFIHNNANIQTSRAAGRIDTARLHAEACSEPILARDRGCGEADDNGYEASAEN
jgi:hypothetical protein